MSVAEVPNAPAARFDVSMALPQLAPSLLLGLCLMGVLLIDGSALLNDPDTQWHAEVGRWIWDHRDVPHTDVFSHTFAGAPWIAKEWLSQLIFFAARAAGGWWAITLLTAAVIAGSFAALHAWLAARMRWSAALAATLVAVALFAPHFLARPHILVLPIILFWMAGLVTALEKADAPPLWLAAAMVAWTNMHGSYPLGLAMAGILAGEGVFLRARSTRVAAARRWGLFLALSAAATLVTPYGWQVVLVPLRMPDNAETFRFVTEWQPIGLDATGATAIGAMLLVFAILLARPKANLFRIVAAGLLAYMALRHSRFVTLFGLIAPILAARTIALWMPAGTLNASTSKILPWFAVAGLAVAILGLASAMRPAPDPKMTPSAAYAFAVSNGVAGPIYNDYDFGGFLIAHGVKTFVDGRTDQLFLHGFLPAIDHALAAKDDRPMAALLRRYGVTWALVRTQSQDAKHIAALPGWSKMYEDQTAAVFVAEREGMATRP